MIEKYYWECKECEKLFLKKEDSTNHKCYGKWKGE
jgi:hypothetical protein